MKKLIAVIALALPLAAQDGFDFSRLDKLGANTDNKVTVTLDGDLLKMAAGFLGDSSDADTKAIVNSLKGVYIRSFKFKQDGMYHEADLEPLRAYLKQGRWSRIVEAREDGENAEIYILPETGGRLAGVAIISAEPREVTVVYIAGSLKPEDVAKMSGSLGIPDLGRQRNRLRAPEKKAAPKQEED